jgi:hypothetical protein
MYFSLLPGLHSRQLRCVELICDVYEIPDSDKIRIFVIFCIPFSNYRIIDMLQFNGVKIHEYIEHLS